MSRWGCSSALCIFSGADKGVAQSFELKACGWEVGSNKAIAAKGLGLQFMDSDLV